jgi:hypothetical protein
MDRMGPGQHDQSRSELSVALPGNNGSPQPSRSSIRELFSHQLRGNFLRWAGHSLKSSRNVGMTLDVNLESAARGRAQAAIGGDHRRALSRPGSGTAAVDGGRQSSPVTRVDPRPGRSMPAYPGSDVTSPAS